MLRTACAAWRAHCAGVSPGIVKQIIPLLDQLTPIYLDIAAGAQEFTPPPEESRTIVRQGGWAGGQAGACMHEWVHE